MIQDWLYKKAIDGTTVGILITDFQQADNPIVYANPYFCRLTGYSLDEVMGRNCRFLQGKDTDYSQTKKIRESIAHATTFRGLLLNYKKNGDPFWNLLTISPLRDAQGIITNFVGIQEDVSASVGNEKKADSINRELTDFCSSVAHDLKTPLAAIYGYVQLLQHSSGKADSMEVLGKIESITARTLEMITNILDYSVVGISESSKEIVDLNIIVSELLETFHPAKEKSIKVLSKLPSVKGHRMSLYRLLQNLISNSLEYGGDQIQLDFQSTNGVYRFSVHDNGPGVPKENQNSIFNIGFSDRKHGGIGLALSRKIVALHGGRIWCESTPGEGATFYFTLVA